MDSFIAWLSGTFLIILSVLTTIMAFIGIFYTIWDFKYRKDLNINLRKTTAENIVKNFYLFIDGILDKEKMKDSKADLKLITYFKSPITKRRYIDSVKKIKRLKFDHKLIFEQFKNYERIKDDFYVSKNLKFNDYALKHNVIEEKITEKKEILFILLLLNIALFTETLLLVSIQDEKYNRIYKYICKVCG